MCEKSLNLMWKTEENFHQNFGIQFTAVCNLLWKIFSISTIRLINKRKKLLSKKILTPFLLTQISWMILITKINNRHCLKFLVIIKSQFHRKLASEINGSFLRLLLDFVGKMKFFGGDLILKIIWLRSEIVLTEA